MLVYLTSPWIPAEWIQAHGLEARGAWFAPDFALDRAALSAGICAFSEAVVRLAEGHPEVAVVFSSHCDQLRRGFDSQVSPHPERRFLFNLPSTWQTPAARRLLESELARLGRFLVALGGRPPAPGELDRILVQSGRHRTRMLSEAPHLSARQFAEALARFYWEGEVRPPRRQAESSQEQRGTEPLNWGWGVSARTVPIALVGGPLPRGQWRLLDLLEGAGARVVLNATEVGERGMRLCSPPETLQDRDGGGSPPEPGAFARRGSEEPTRVAETTRRLAQHCLENMIDVFQRPNTRLYAWLGERIEARKVSGIVLWAYTGCDLWRAEVQSLREAFGRPVLLLDADEVATGWARLNSRIEAFLESLRGGW